MNKLVLKTENLLSSLPPDSEEKHFYARRVEEYSNECGCSLGAKFLIISLAISAVYFFLSDHSGFMNIVGKIMLGIFFVFTSSIAGKLIGIGIARIRLALLYKNLSARYPLRGEKDVYLHKVG